MGVGGQPRIEHEVPWQLTMLALPELDEAEDLLGLLALAQIGVGVAEGATAGVLRKEGQHAGLSATAGRHEVPLHLRIVAVVRHRMEVQVERARIEQHLFRDRPVPGPQQPHAALALHPRGVLAQVALLGHDVQAAEQRQARIGDEGHDVALALDGP